LHRILRASDQQRSSGGTLTFEGEPFGSGVSFFLVNNQPGEGPDLHRHPYPETWIVRSGRARFTADGQDVEVGPGDITVVTSETPHKFKNIGTERLDIICIHASARIIQEDLEE
jgi:mannose-6-phosphate isomerase-like protein (cupin superfamily)